jgi:hypothetical protein
MKAKPLTDAGFRQIEAPLTPGVNRERLRAELKRESAPSAQELEQIAESEGARRKHAEACRDLLTMEQGLDEPNRELCKLLLAREKWAVAEAEAWARAGKDPLRSHYYLHFIRAYDVAGGDVRVTTPYKPEEDAHYPEPKSEFVSYFLEVVEVLLGVKVSAHTAKRWGREYRHMNFSDATIAGEGSMSVAANQGLAAFATLGGEDNRSIDADIPREKP